MYNWKTLIVDDEPEIISSLKNNLEKFGLSVTIANNFKEALELINKEKFELAILDISLPDGNGINLFRVLRDKNIEMYTIVITGNATIDNAITALNEGVNAYLVKPFSENQLNDAINQAEENLIQKSQYKSLFQTIDNNRQFYENLLNSTSEAILVVDLEYRIRYCNQTASSLLQLDELESGDRFIHDYFEDGYKIISHIHHQMIEGRSISGFKGTIKSLDGEKYEVHLSADFLYGKNREIEGLIINVSNPVVYNEVINRVMRKERLSTIINLASTLSHVIRNPINILSGRLQLIDSELNQGKFKKAYNTIQRQIDRILEITDLLGKFNLIKEDTIPEKCNIVAIFKKTLQDKLTDFEAKDIKIKDNISDKNILTEGNQYQFSDAFEYLFNAILNLVPGGNNLEILGKENVSGENQTGYEIQIVLSGIKLTTNQLFESIQKTNLESDGFLELEMALMDLTFHNYGIKFDLIIQNDIQTLVRIQIPSIKNTNTNLLKFG